MHLRINVCGMSKLAFTVMSSLNLLIIAPNERGTKMLFLT